MTDRAAIDAQVVDIQNDRQYKGFLKVTLHIAAERGKLLTDVLGTWPTYTDPVPVALARLTRLAAPSQDGDAEAPFPIASVSGKTRPSISPEKRLVQQAAILCGDPKFRLFLEKTFLPKDNKCNTDDDAAEIVRHLCDVTTRSDILVGTAAGDKWEKGSIADLSFGIDHDPAR